jgi:hypothetical protein
VGTKGLPGRSAEGGLKGAEGAILLCIETMFALVIENDDGK